MVYVAQLIKQACHDWCVAGSRWQHNTQLLLILYVVRDRVGQCGSLTMHRRGCWLLAVLRRRGNGHVKAA